MNKFYFIFILFLLIGCGNPEKKDLIVSLTFDDGPDKICTELILDILKEKNVKATFFALGDNMVKYPTVTKRIINDGHCLANHSSNHMRFKGKSLNQIIANIQRTEDIIDSFGGNSLKLFRPPWGEIDDKQKDSIEMLGYSIVLWEISSGDWNTKKNNVEKIIDNVVGEIKPGDIILFHDADYTGVESRMNTVKALPVILDSLKSLGYKFVKVDDILKLRMKSKKSIF